MKTSRNGRARGLSGMVDAAGRARGAMAVERLEGRMLLAADLNVTAIETDNEVIGPGNEFEAEFTIKNDGDASTNPFRVEYRLSRNTTWGDADDVILGFRHVNAPLTPGGQTTLAEEFTLPRNVFTGNYHLGALADSLGQITEANENNNLRFTSIAQIIVVNASGQVNIDLEAEGVAATGGTYNAGQSFPGIATYRNNGTFPTGSFTTIWFLSLNQVFGDADDVTLGIATSPGGLAASGFFNDSFTLDIPISTPSGNYYFGVFVDARFVVNEPLEEDNNIDFSATPTVAVVGVPTIPDLQAFDIATTGGEFEPGQEITFTATIKNGGNAATGPFEVTYALSVDNILSNPDDVVLFFKVIMNSIAAGATATDTRTVAIPSAAVGGEYFIGMVLDPDDDLDEGQNGEANNTDFTPTALVEVVEPPPPTPQITVLGGGSLGTEIDHNVKARRADGTGYGPVEADGGEKEITYKIRNTGLQTLTITLIEPRGQTPGDYEVIVQPSLTILPGESSDFEVRFSPSEFGTRRANIAIFTNDPSRPRFTMKIAGRGMPPETAPDIDVQGDGNSISDNDRKARADTDTRYGNVELGETTERIYTIRNEGGSTLTLTTPFVSIGGQDPTHFEVLIQPADLVLEPGEETTFTVRFAPTTIGQKKAEVQVFTDDPDEGVFNFRIIGTGAE